MLGRGGMGEVRRVRDRKVGHTLAMKLLSWDLVDDSPSRERFQREARLTAELQHPGIVSVQDMGELADGRLWYTMTEVEGETLGDLLEAGELSLRRMVEILLRVSEAVDYAHAQRVLHLDLKPDNLMVGAFGEVRVMDWGLARPHHAREEEVLGTPTWMAPEQARDGKVGAYTDVYALGAILFRILAGRAPYPGSTSGVWADLLAGPPPSLAALAPEAPAELVELAERGMARDAAKRPRDAGVWGRGLRDWLEGARRRQQADELLARADAMVEAREGLCAELESARAAAAASGADLRPFDPVAVKRPTWQLDDAADALHRRVVDAEVAWLQTVRSALQLAPHHVPILDRLAAHYQQAMVRAERRGDRDAAARAEAELRAYDRGAYARFLRGDATLDLDSEPRGASVTLARFQEVDRRLQLGPRRSLGLTPLQDVRLTAGRYLLELRHPECATVAYPIELRRSGRWDSTPPGDTEPQAVWLPRSIPEDTVYIPGGWAQIGGDAEAPDALAGQRVWVDGFFIQRDPVTEADYLAFIRDTAVTDPESAARWMPRGVRQGHRYLNTAAGFHLAPDPHTGQLEPQAPVTLVDWHGAMAFAAWRARATGLAWRLPTGHEHEKAARGVDGRAFPWGDAFDPTFARMAGSLDGAPRRAPVGEPPTDVSPYGVRGLAGNVRDWCIEAWRREGSAVRSGRAVVDAASAEGMAFLEIRGGEFYSPARHCRAAARTAGRPGDRFSTVGFRLARSARTME